jgi:hypothetical protein
MDGAGIAQWYSAGLRSGWSEVRVPAWAWNFSPHHCVQTGSGAHPASYPVGKGTLSLGIKRPGRKANHSPRSSAKVKNAWSYTSTPPILLHGVVLRWSTETTLPHLTRNTQCWAIPHISVSEARNLRTLGCKLREQKICMWLSLPYRTASSE